MYSIIRAKKLKSFGAIVRSAKHTFREHPTPNAVSELTPRNRVVGASNTSAMLQKLNERLPAKRRSDAVLCIEYLITASPEAFRRHGGPLNELGSGYFKDALKWLQERHGSGNVICAAVHLDESTPHMVAYVVPLTNDGRLSARDFLGGPKVMRSLQDSFHAACGARRGLSRGMKGSKAKHEDIAKFYGALAEAGASPRLTPLDYAKKAVGVTSAAWNHAEAIARANAQGITLERRRRKTREARLKALEGSEIKAASGSLDLQKRERLLAKREQAVTDREHELALSEPELNAARVQLEAMSRMVSHKLMIEKTPTMRPDKRHTISYEVEL